jgi:molybdopterin adenylyltransferase
VTQVTGEQQHNLPELLGYALVAPRIKVMYVPTTKVACSTLKLFISQAEGCYNASVAQEIITPNISQEQTVHNYRVHGLTRFLDMSDKEKWEIINSPDWLRVAALRDPIKRAYSSWENRAFLRAPGTPQSVIDACGDVSVDGRVDVAATFKKFARAIHADRDSFAIDDHFRPQFNTLYSNQVDYHHLIRIDNHGEMQNLADIINKRAGTNIQLQRLNSGLGIKPEQVCDKETADLIAATYKEDYEWFGFAPHQITAPTASFVLDALQQALLLNLRQTTERLQILSRAAFNRGGSLQRIMSDKAVARIGVVTVSDRAFAGVYEDLGGPAIISFLTQHLTSEWVAVSRVVPDETDVVAATLIELADVEHCSLIVTTGGTGPALRDITPEATEQVCAKMMPGFGELMRQVSLQVVPTAILSRQTAGIRGSSLIINLPGKPSSISDCLTAVLPASPYCIDIIGGAHLEVGNGLEAFRPKSK